MYMFIRKVKMKNKGYSKEYYYHYLVESVRTQDGPRQKLILNLGTLDLPKKDWALLAGRIEEIVKRQGNFFAVSPQIERLANFYARKIINKNMESLEKEKDFREVDINGTEVSECRSVGTEHACLSYLKLLELDKYLESCGFTKRQINVAILLIIGRMISPGSERYTHFWAQNISGLDELMETDFTRLSLNTLYKVSDKLYAQKKGIESFLADRERDIFSLKETIILYDLTNTYLEGECRKNKKAKFGRSKEKRNDCRLMTLGLVIDDKGFPKASKIFEGNQDDPGSLKKMLEELKAISSGKNLLQDNDKITVVVDAGIATEDNLKMLKGENFYYVCVSRKKPDFVFEGEDLLTLKENATNKIEVKLFKPPGEDDTYLYCKSQAKGKKEKSMRNKFEQLFEQGLANIEASLHKKRGTKNYQKVCERVGRLRQKYPLISQYYDIDVVRGRKQKSGYAVRIHWEYIKEDKADEKFSGSYYLRTNRDDLNESQIWSIYSMLTKVEDAFRSVKSELGIRPIHHQKDTRVESHIFISLLAYHIVISIQNRLNHCGYNRRWRTIRRLLSTHIRQTVELPTKDGKIIYIRKCSKPEFNHKQVYEFLLIPEVPVSALKKII